MKIRITESQYNLILEGKEDNFKRVKLPYDYSDLEKFYTNTYDKLIDLNMDMNKWFFR